uniref:BED-type domain-containing protein n=1 Tax=Caenorhabditis tropicalis TaxID=1561998 RepID=A0A1I7SYS4_9PELO
MSPPKAKKSKKSVVWRFYEDPGSPNVPKVVCPDCKDEIAYCGTTSGLCPASSSSNSDTSFDAFVKDRSFIGSVNQDDLKVICRGRQELDKDEANDDCDYDWEEDEEEEEKGDGSCAVTSDSNNL